MSGDLVKVAPSRGASARKIGINLGLIMATKAERSQQTQGIIIDEARKIFARDGFTKASLSEIVKNADVTTGAIYHHFGDKKGLFAAVAEHLEQELLALVAEKIMTIEDAWERLEQGVAYTLEVSSREDMQRIIYQEAPTVVGVHEWRTIEMKYGLGVMRAAIHEMMEDGIIVGQSADLVAQILLGAIIEAAHAVALASDKKAALEEAKGTVLTMLRGIRV